MCTWTMRASRIISNTERIILRSFMASWKRDLKLVSLHKKEFRQIWQYFLITFYLNDSDLQDLA